MQFKLVSLASLLFALSACSAPPKDTTDPESTADTEVGEPTAGAEPELSETPTPTAGLSAQDCEAQSGSVVGDIGDGAIHKPDYVCPTTGLPPLGPIVPADGEPIATEGAVCCPPVP